MQSIEDKVVSRIYGKGRGWAFSQKDFADLGSRSAIDLAFHRLHQKQTIRRVIRGIYDYPKYSDRLQQLLSPSIDQVAQALARKFGWQIQPSGPAALNALGLSTQVPGTYLYLSSGPNRSYQIDKIQLTFENAPTKEVGFQYYESTLIVRALKSLGSERIDNNTIVQIRAWLDPRLKAPILKDTMTATGWVYEAIRRICLEDAADG